MRLKTNIDGTLNQKNLNAIARQVAGSQYYTSWGAVTSQKKMRGKDVWHFSCEGHGGYIAIRHSGNAINVPDGFKPIVVFGVIAEVFVFEEDCDWAVLEYFNKDIMEWSLADHNSWSKSKITVEEWNKYVFDTIVSWNTRYVKPEHKEQARTIVQEKLDRFKAEYANNTANTNMEGYRHEIERQEEKLKMVS